MYMVILYVIHDGQEASAKIVNFQAPGGFATRGHIVKILIIFKKMHVMMFREPFKLKTSWSSVSWVQS